MASGELAAETKRAVEEHAASGELAAKTKHAVEEHAASGELAAKTKPAVEEHAASWELAAKTKRAVEEHAAFEEKAVYVRALRLGVCMDYMAFQNPWVINVWGRLRGKLLREFRNAKRQSRLYFVPQQTKSLLL